MSGSREALSLSTVDVKAEQRHSVMQHYTGARFANQCSRVLTMPVSKRIVLGSY